MIVMKNKLLALEFLLLCICLPSVIIAFRFAPYMFFFLWSATLYCFFILRFKHNEHFLDIWKWKSVTWSNMKPILIRFVIATIGMVAFIYAVDPDRIFGIVRDRPQIIPFLLVIYPVLSALPQEFIFCSFFFERYQKFFPRTITMILASALVFAFAHVLYINWIAPLLSFIAGIIFATTYAKTKSLALVTIEHGLYGNALFLVGLGWYFYGGAVAQ